MTIVVNANKHVSAIYGIVKDWFIKRYIKQHQKVIHNEQPISGNEKLVEFTLPLVKVFEISDLIVFVIPDRSTMNTTMN